jgi:hypothetical protein
MLQTPSFTRTRGVERGGCEHDQQPQHSAPHAARQLLLLLAAAPLARPQTAARGRHWQRALVSTHVTAQQSLTCECTAAIVVRAGWCHQFAAVKWSKVAMIGRLYHARARELFV